MWLSSVPSLLPEASKSAPRGRRPKPRFRPGLEVLEDRTVPTIFNVAAGRAAGVPPARPQPADRAAGRGPNARRRGPVLGPPDDAELARARRVCVRPRPGGGRTAAAGGARRLAEAVGGHPRPPRPHRPDRRPTEAGPVAIFFWPRWCADFALPGGRTLGESEPDHAGAASVREVAVLRGHRDHLGGRAGGVSGPGLPGRHPAPRRGGGPAAGPPRAAAAAGRARSRRADRR